MTEERIGALVVDDSALMRKLIKNMIDDTPGMHTLDTAGNGKIALAKIPELKPDVIVLDIEMPEMNGIEFLKERQRLGIRAPVIILSSLAEKGAAITMEAILLGASDFILKPSGSISLDIAGVRERLAELISAYGGRYRRLNSCVAAAAGPGGDNSGLNSAGGGKGITPVRKTGKIELVALGISTGGPEALRVMLPKLDAGPGVPVVLVQHMPAGFTEEFARSLNRLCRLEVKEAENGEELRPDCVYIARGDRHLEVERKLAKGYVRLSDAPQVSGHKPSVDVLFASAALQYQNHVLGVIMTGMGKDGAVQLGSIYREGGLTLAQDEASSVVYGMPRVAAELGHVMEQVSLDNMAERILRLIRQQADSRV